MAVNLEAPEFLHALAGVRLGVAEAAIKKPGRKDVLVVEFSAGTQVAGVFTQNAFAAAPVLICREILARSNPVRALLINSGNANAATGKKGIADAQAVCAEVARELGCASEQVLPFSTGVIGQQLPLARFTAAVPAAVKNLRADGWLDAMHAIMTTDTVPKGATRQISTSQGLVTVTGVAKGVGMIHPDMATLLAFVGTDANLTVQATRTALQQAVGKTFNCVTVDGDTSTNDSCVLFATGKVGGAAVDESHPDFAAIARTIQDVCRELAQAVVRDGEGATKFISIEVRDAKTEAEARQVALSIAHSPLVKTAMFASDANWGRIAMAIGKSGIVGLEANRVSVALDNVPLIDSGEPDPGYSEEKGAAVVSKAEFSIRVRLGRGDSQATVWTCDFSYDYVKINAEYRT